MKLSYNMVDATSDNFLNWWWCLSWNELVLELISLNTYFKQP